MQLKAVVLIVDDQPKNLDILVHYLADSGLELMIATDGEQALGLACERTPDLVLLDLMMPGIDGYEVCHKLKSDEATQSVPVIFMSALTDTDSKVKGFQVGAIDFIDKPFQREEVLARIRAHLIIRVQQQELQQKNRQLEGLNQELQEQVNRRHQAEQALHLADERLSALTKQEAEHWGIDAFIGQSRVTRLLLEEVRSLQLAAQTNVLVLGESGTGKELISRAIHYGSSRNSKPFVAVNCSAIPLELADSEFFGHTKGAYTGAVANRNGYFVQADGGTLFLDEIGDMPLTLQAKLLRVLEDGLVTPIGGRQSRRVNVRVVAATNVDLKEKVQRKRFRQDLFFRLAGYQISLPPLRERIGDIMLLIEHFLTRLGGQMGCYKPTITQDAVATIVRYHFPGNVRELKNLIEYALIASRGHPIGVNHLHFLEAPVSSPTAYTSDSYSASFSADNISSRKNTDTANSSETANTVRLAASSQEAAIMQYISDHAKIDNGLTQELLGVDHGRASYLLKKLYKEGRLSKQGERRWTHYTIANNITH